MKMSDTAGDRHRRQIRTAVGIAALAFVVLNVGAGFARSSEPSRPANDAEIEAFLIDQVRDAGYPGAAFAIVRDDRVSHAGGIGIADGAGRPVGPDSPFVIGSLSKAITATAVMQLVETGHLELDAPVTRYLADFAVVGARADEITVRHLLHQTSGLPTAAGVAPLAGPVTSLEAQVRALASVELEHDPGTSFAYSNANYVVLGRLIERVSGVGYGAYVTDAIFRPLQMDDAHVDLSAARRDGLVDAHRFWFGVPEAGDPLWRPDLQPAGWLIASANDLGRFAAASLNGGELDGGRILSRAGITQMQTGAVSVLRGAYGMGWIDGRLGATRIVSHSGSTTDMASLVYLAPDEHSGIVLLLNGQSVVYELLHKAEAIGEAAFARMLGEPTGGTLSALYPVFTVVSIVLLAYQLRSLARVVRRARRGQAMVQHVRGSRSLGTIIAIWGRFLIPALVLWTTPLTLGAPWEVLVHIDLGQVLAAYAVLQLLIGVVSVVPIAVRHARSERLLVGRAHRPRPAA